MEVHDPEAFRSHREVRDKEPPGGYGGRARHPDALVDAGVAQDALVDPALVEEQDEGQRREDRERPEGVPERRCDVAVEPEEQRDGERLYYYRSVHQHRRPAPERGRRPSEGPLHPVNWTREPFPHSLKGPHGVTF